MSVNGKDDFNRLRAQFSRRANAPEVPALASKLCWWIAFGRMDTKRRSTFVTQKTLADDLGGVTVRTVQRMIDVLKPLGLNVAPGHGPDMASTYWIGEANTNTTSMSPIQPGQGDTGVGPTRHFRRRKATLVSRHIKNSKKISKKVSNERDAEGGVSHTSRAARESTVDAAPLNPANSTNQDAPVPATDGPIARPAASEVAGLKQPVAEQNPKPSRVNPIGTAPDGVHGPARFEVVKQHYPPDWIGDPASALRAFVATGAAHRDEADLIADVKDFVHGILATNGKGPALAEALKAISNGISF